MLVREELTDALIGLIPEDGSRISNGEIMAELEKLQEELEGLNTQARELEVRIAQNVEGILER